MVTKRQWRLLLASCLSGCAVGISPPLWVFRPPTVQAFGAAWGSYNLIISIVMLVTIAFILGGATIGDLYGRRRTMLLGLGGLIVANTLLLITPWTPWFLTTRFLGAVSGAFVTPLSLTLLYLTFPEKTKSGTDVNERARMLAIGIYLILTTVANLSSGLLGGLMKSLFDWRVAFFPSTALAILAFVMVWKLTDESHVQERFFDAIGYSAWTLLLLSLTFGVIVYRAAGRYSIMVLLASLSLFAIALVLLVWWDRSAPETMDGRLQIPLRAVTSLTLFNIALQIGMVGLLTQVRSALMAVYGYSTVLASIALAPFVLGMLIMLLPPVQKRLQRFSLRNTMTLSLIVLGVSIALTAWIFGTRLYGLVAILMMICGLAAMAANTAWTGIFLVSVPNDMVGVRTGMNSAISQMGSSIAVAFTTRLLADTGEADYTRRLLEAGVASDRLQAALSALNVVLDPSSADGALVDANIALRLLVGYQQSYTYALQYVMVVVAGVCLIGGIVLWMGLGGIRTNTSNQPPELAPVDTGSHADRP